ncbi:hypothetical protein [Streptomyces sp. bgisy159]|uniref:hypothetical protein n=1 Tax=Streptomyces sp. bgisy159 TaxID=3413795 RepID=UPI003F49E0E7
MTPEPAAGGGRAHASPARTPSGTPAALPLPRGAGAALDPVRTRLLADAREAARALLAAADRDADAAVRDAGASAARILAEARRQGRADADHRVSAERVRARRAARARELAARRACWEELCRQVVAGVEALRRTDTYPPLRDGLAARVRAALGPDAVITEAPGGGVVGEVPGRRIDCRLATFARRALDRAAAGEEEPWVP